MERRWEQAVSRGDIAAVERCLRDGADVNARDRYGQTALMLAAHAGRQALVELLIAWDADLNVTAKFGLSALMLAIVGGHEDVARALVKAGADTTLRGAGAPGFAGKTARDLAAARGLLALCAELPSEG